MMNVKDNMTETADFIELVTPKNGETEDKWVLVIVTLVVSIAFLLLHLLYSHQHQDSSVIPDGVRQHIMSFSIAAEELGLLAELEGRVPALEDIINLGTQPFAVNTFPTSNQVAWYQYDDCFLGRFQSKGQLYQLRLIVLSNSSAPYHLSWRSTMNEAIPGEETCDDAGWNTIGKENILSKHNHAN